jgi:ornithine carbamoyltransferase
MQHFLSMADLSAETLAWLLERARYLKSAPAAAQLPHAHAIALLLERPSLRTRTAYEVAMMHLGGHGVVFETLFSQRETASDVARTMSHLVSAIVVRVRDHALLEELAAHAEVPVVNALSNREHPVEVLADALTLREYWGKLQGRRLAYVGDGNNICHSLLLLGSLAGMDVAVASPAGHAPAPEIVNRAQELAGEHGTRVDILTDPRKAVVGADAVYTDVWAGMGQADTPEQRRQVFQPYQLNRDLLSLAKPDAVVLHCLPARRGEEITSDVLDGPQSLAFRRLSNLVPVKMAVLSWLLQRREPTYRVA